ncbi:MAG: N-acetylmuramoyl-L-alanine amidase [Rubrobacteraceae bacterium]
MAKADYRRARWYGAYSGNYSRANRPKSHRINKVVIHVVEGSWSSAINWFKDPRAKVSAHYTVRSSDGFIGQSVREKDIAWHAGNWPVNQTSIGIEHEGYGDQPARWFTPRMYNSSARLTAYLCRKYKIPIRRAANTSQSGILAHRQATSTACPGQWDFDRYIRLVRRYARSSPKDDGGSEQIVDNKKKNRFKASGNWRISSYHKDQSQGPNYHYANPSRSRVDPARFKVRIPKSGRYTIYARWPADPGYNNRTTFRVRTANGARSRTVSQQRNGGRWVRLGTYSMRKGTGWFVEVSRKSRGKGYVIADAIKVVKR